MTVKVLVTFIIASKMMLTGIGASIDVTTVVVCVRAALEWVN